MINKCLTFIIVLLLTNIIAQDTNTNINLIDSQATSNEVVSSTEDIDSSDENLLDSLYDTQEEPVEELDTADKIVDDENIELKGEKKDNTKEIEFEKENSPVEKKVQTRFNSNIKKIFIKLYENKIKIVAIFIFFVLAMITVFSFIKRKEGEKFLTSTRLSLMDKEVQIACKYLEKNYSNSDLTVEEMCEELVTGVAFLEALFTKELGMSIKEFLVQVRINRARDAINNNPSMPSYEIAEKCGYSDAVLFEQDFKKTTGLSLDDYISSKVN